MISFAFPWIWLALPLPYLVWRFVPPYGDSVPALRFPFFRRIVTTTGKTPKPGVVVLDKLRFQTISAILIWGLVITALAQPERVGAPVEINKAARDIVLAIDISGSMDAVDFTGPDGKKLQRLDAVQQVVRRFIEGRDGDRIALVVFGSQAYLQAPLTEDLTTIVDLLEQTTVGMAGPQTALGDAIGLTIRTFEASDVDQRLLILLSDGSDNASLMTPFNAAEIARTSKVEIFTIGVGDPEGSGENKVDLVALEEIARRTGGNYFYAADQNALTEIYNRIDLLTPRKVESLSYRPRQSLSFIPLMAAGLLGILTLAILIRRRRVHG